MELIHISLETGDIIPFEETFPVSYLSSLAFLDAEQILYSSPSNNPVIYNLRTHTQSFIPLSTQKPVRPLLTKDLSLIAFVTLNNKQTNFNFFNVLQSRGASSLDFRVDDSVTGLDLANRYIVYQDDSTLYVKDILSNRLPVSIAASNNGIFSTYFTTNPNDLLYTIDTGKQINIYRVDLRNQQSRLLLENAQLLN